jgi:hypothetical protein
MPLGQGIAEMWDALRDRVELSGHGPTWEVTAGSFDTALAYSRERFGDPVVLRRADRGRWWPRVTLTVTTNRELAAAAPPLDELATPTVPAQRTRETAPTETDQPEPPRETPVLPSSLEAIFAHQEELRLARQRTPDHDNPAS